MGYFSNGTEQGIYEERYCERCVHFDHDKGCPVMGLHWRWNYAQRGELKEAMNMLIPNAVPENEVCKMFIAKPKEVK